MPSEDYAPVVRGALKLKGSTPSGVTKKKKKKKKTTKPTTESEGSEAKKGALQKALEEEDAASTDIVRKGKGKEGENGDGEGDMRELEERGNDGKTASERAREEMRRKRVCFFFTFSLLMTWEGI